MQHLDSRQTEYRGILQQLFPYMSGPTLDILLASINADLTSPLRVDATSSPSLVVDIGPAIVSNPESGRNKSISYIGNVVPVFTSGTVTFPSTDGGTITASTGQTQTLTLPSNNYAQALLAIDGSGDLIVTMGGASPTLGGAVLPAPIGNTLPFSYVTLFNNAGVIDNIIQSMIFQFVGGGGSGGSTPTGGEAQEVVLTSGTTSIDVTYVNPQVGTTYVVLAQIINITDTNPEYIPVTITAKSTTGFTATWNTPLETSNYLLDYMVSPGLTQEQTGESLLTIGTITQVVTLPIPLASSSYVVIAELTNLVDSFPQFQPITITAKTISNFTVKWNAPINTTNYRLEWKVTIYQ